MLPGVVQKMSSAFIDRSIKFLTSLSAERSIMGQICLFKPVCRCFDLVVWQYWTVKPLQIKQRPLKINLKWSLSDRWPYKKRNQILRRYLTRKNGWLDWTTSGLLRFYCLFLARGLHARAAENCFYVGSRDLNSHPHTYTSILPTETSAEYIIIVVVAV